MAAVEGAVAGAGAVAAGTGPGAALGAAPVAACQAPCPNAACIANAGMGCYESHGTPPAVTWECVCPPPPPPPVVGSPEWMTNDEQQIQVCRKSEFLY